MYELWLTAARFPWLSRQQNHTKVTRIKMKKIVLVNVHDQGPNPIGLKLNRGVLGNLLSQRTVCVLL